MSKAVVIAGGPIDNYEWHKRIVNTAELVVCADCGGRHAFNMGIVPHYVVGDLDSLDPELETFFRANGTQFVGCYGSKDITDTDIAVQFALDKGARDITIIGALGLRFDHSWANISLLVPLLETGIPACLINENNTVRLTKRHIIIDGVIGDSVSLLPVTPLVKGVHTRGLRDTLTNRNLIMGTSIGIGNRLTEPCAEVILEEGILAVIQSKD